MIRYIPTSTDSSLGLIKISTPNTKVNSGCKFLIANIIYYIPHPIPFPNLIRSIGQKP